MTDWWLYINFFISYLKPYLLVKENRKLTELLLMLNSQLSVVFFG